jgi:hypothetical protein
MIGRIFMTPPSDEPAIDSARVGRELVILPPRAKRVFRYDLRSIGIGGACLVLAGAVGWAAGAQLASPDPLTTARAQKSDAAQPVGQSETQQRQEIRELADQLRMLKSGLASVQTSLERRPDDMKALKASVEGIRQGLDAAKADTAAAIAQLSGKLDRSDQAMAQKFAQIAERLDRSERKPDQMPVGSITPQPPARPTAIQALPAPASTQPAKPVEAATPLSHEKIPIPGFVLRDVYDGVALIEGRGVYREVVVGQAIPGAGKVEAIERRGRRWVVVTSQGLITGVN